MKKQDRKYQIGALAREAGLSVYAVRYYESQGLLSKVPRTAGGFRIYRESDLDKLLFIRQAQGFGLSLEEIRGILPCSPKGLEPCCDLAVRLFERKILEYETKIRELQNLKKQIRKLLATGTFVKIKKAGNHDSLQS